MATRLLGNPSPQSAGYLLWRPTKEAEAVPNPLVKPASRHQLARPATATTPLPIGGRGPGGAIGAELISASRQLPTDSRDMAAKTSGNGTGTLALTGLDHDGGAFLVTEVLVASSHRNILPARRGRCCT